MESDENIHIEVAYATSEESYLLTVVVPSGSTIAKGIEVSGILVQCPEIDLSKNKVGIFSKLKTLDDILREGDRVEIYRPLKIDPKVARREKADNLKKQKK